MSISYGLFEWLVNIEAVEPAVEYPALPSAVECGGAVGFILRVKAQVFSLILYKPYAAIEIGESTSMCEMRRLRPSSVAVNHPVPLASIVECYPVAPFFELGLNRVKFVEPSEHECFPQIGQ